MIAWKYNNFYILEMIYENFSMAPDLRPETMNVVINIACSGARRSLKITPEVE